MSWDEYYSYQKGGSNWGGNTQRGHSGGGILRVGNYDENGIYAIRDQEPTGNIGVEYNGETGIGKKWERIVRGIWIGTAIVGIAAIGLTIGVYYGAIAGSEWAMSIAGRSWLARGIYRFFLTRRFVKAGQQVFRLWGGESVETSPWWGPGDPRLWNVIEQRKYLQLTPGNAATDVTSGTLTGDLTGVVAQFVENGGAVEIVLTNPLTQVLIL